MITDKEMYRFIITKPLSARENMAIDEALLTCFDDKALPIFRLYCWEEDSVTIGASQNIETYDHLNREKIAKRVTGGGVLFHGHDLSYSLIIPTDAICTLNVKESYETLCTFLFHFYERLELAPVYVKDDSSVHLFKDAYCQVGFEAYDILIHGKKIGGNAQRRTKKAIFQHGSIPILKTKAQRQIGFSLRDVGIDLSISEAIVLLGDSFEETFNLSLEESRLTEEEEKIKELLLKGKYHYGIKQENKF